MQNKNIDWEFVTTIITDLLNKKVLFLSKGDVDRNFFHKHTREKKLYTYQLHICL